MNEQWKGIEGFENFYEVSNMGQVRSLARTIKIDGKRGCYEKHYKAALMKLTVDRDGYRTLGLTIDGKMTNCKVHRLVCAAFNGPCPEDGVKRICAHEDGDPSNNASSNLSWKTDAENAKDKIRHGSQAFAGDRHDSSLTNAQVAAARLYPYSHGTNAIIAKLFGLSRTALGSAIKGRRYGSVNEQDYVGTTEFEEAMAQIKQAVEVDGVAYMKAIRTGCKPKVSTLS